MAANESGLEVKALAEDHVAFPGYGVFAQKTFLARQFIEGYIGVALTYKQLKVKYNKEKATYVLKVGRDRFICAEDPQTSNFWRYVNSNHGTPKKSNCTPLDIGLGLILKDIEPGAELLYNYGIGFVWNCATPGPTPARVQKTSCPPGTMRGRSSIPAPLPVKEGTPTRPLATVA